MLPAVVAYTSIMRSEYKSQWFGPLIIIAHCFGVLVVLKSEMLQAARSEYEQEQVPTEVLNILDPGNELLQGLVNDLRKIRSSPNKAQVACLFELQPSNVEAIVDRQHKTVGTLLRGLLHRVPHTSPHRVSS
ncbi:hypothetical protein D6C89_10571 [Aureobasidium pullulans]|nr:hypothetical protein D6C89_10571 [Aureobasidium pullulans]